MFRKLFKRESVINDLFFLIISFILLKVVSVLVLNKLPVIYGIDFSKFRLYYLPFCVGYLWRKNDRIGTFLESELIYFICLFIFISIFTLRVIYGESNFIAAHGKSAMSLSACVCILSLFKHKQRPALVTKILSYLGQKSLQIYVFHILFILRFSSVCLLICKQDFLNSVLLQILYSFTLSVIAIILSIICTNVISYSYYQVLLFGIQKKKQ